MKKFYTQFVSFLFTFFVVAFSSTAQLTENFDNITTLTGSGWFMQNNSSPIGTSNWFQGNDAAFPSFNGATTSYIGANFNNTAGTGTISNWLVTPNFTIKNGDVITFYTRTTTDNMWADNLQVRMSTNGASTNVGSGPTTVGDFTTLLLEINPGLALSTYPMAWTQYTITVSGLAAPTSGRFAFRYFVTNGGPSGTNSDYIGIDNFVYTPYVCPTLTVTPSSLTNGTAGALYSQNLSQTGALGTPTYTVIAGTLPPGITLSTGGILSGTPTGTGTFNFTVQVADASGCLGSTAYTLMIDCPTNGASLASFPQFCDNDSPYIMSEGSPSGGTYSGTGVTGSSFDPSVGTSLITYSFTDVYGCLQSTSQTITVNNAPTVTLSTYSGVCDNAGSFNLTGNESPSGGVFSGTGVSGNNFNPAVGNSNITYTYTDGNGCSNSAQQPITVNAAPTVSLAAFSDECQSSNSIALSGGLPAGGTYSGTNVSGGFFTPSALGTTTITYTYTNGNNCTNNATQPLNVVNCVGLAEVNYFDMQCYPIPAESTITLTFNVEPNQNYTISILSVDGQVVSTENVNPENSLFNKSYDVSNLESGVYFFQVVSNGVISKKQFIVQ